MFRPLSCFLGFRYFLANRSNDFISFISLSSSLGIMLGVAVLIIGLSIINGFEQQLQEKLLTIIPQAELEAPKYSIQNWSKLLSKVVNYPEIVAVAPYISLNMLLDKDKQFRSLQIKAIDPEQEVNVSSVAEFISNDGWQKLQQQKNSLLLGSAIASDLAIQVNQMITLLLVQQTDDSKLTKPLTISMKVVGLIETGSQLDASLALIRLDDAQQLLQTQSIQGIRLKVTDAMIVNNIVYQVIKDIDSDLYFKTWQQTHGYLYQDIQLAKIIMYVILTMTLMIACFNIISYLIMLIEEKLGDIAILKTMGADNNLIWISFMVQGLISGCLGAAFGSILAILIVPHLSFLCETLESLMGVQFLSANIYFIDFMPSQLKMTDVLLVSGLAISVSFIATLYPAYIAKQTQPARELRYK